LKPEQQEYKLPELVSFKWISERYGIPLSSLYLYNRQGHGPKAVKIGRHYRVNIADLNTWLESN
jgi:predicted DNA-binding transcriptional regulator AlpA